MKHLQPDPHGHQHNGTVSWVALSVALLWLWPGDVIHFSSTFTLLCLVFARDLLTACLSLLCVFLCVRVSSLRVFSFSFFLFS